MNLQKRPVRKAIVVVLLLLVAVALGICYRWERMQDEAVTTMIFRTDEARSIFATADVVTVQRMHKRELSQRDRLQLRDNRGSNPPFPEYDLGPPVPEPAAAVKELRKLFLRDLPLRADSTFCIPSYAVLFTFHSGSQQDVKLALCFECDLFAVVQGHSGLNMAADFTPIAPDLTELIGPLFDP